MAKISTWNIVLFTILAISSVFTVRALLESRDLGPAITFEFIPDNADLTLKNIKYTKTRDGEPLWTLVANSAAHSSLEGVTRIENVRMVFFDRELGDIKLTADRGEIKPEDQTVAVSSNVTVTSTQGNTLQTDYLEYDEASNVLQTDRLVKIHVDQYTVNGKGMQVDVAKRTLTLLNDVKAHSRNIGSHEG